VRRENFYVVGQVQQTLDTRVLDRRTLRASEVGSADVADEQRVAAQEDRRLGAARRIDH